MRVLCHSFSLTFCQFSVHLPSASPSFRAWKTKQSILFGVFYTRPDSTSIFMDNFIILLLCCISIRISHTIQFYSFIYSHRKMEIFHHLVVICKHIQTHFATVLVLISLFINPYQSMGTYYTHTHTRAHTHTTLGFLVRVKILNIP